jgi:hypothetical protein
MNDILKRLREPFPADRIEWRLQSCGKKQDGSIWGKALAYIDNRAAMERLDDVYDGKWSHKEEFHAINGMAVCTVTLTLPDRIVSGSCQVEASDDIDPFKSAASGAMKRSVALLGIGRYLYNLEEGWAVIDPKGRYQGKTKEKEYFRWNPPVLPTWAMPSGSQPQSTRQEEYVDSTPENEPVEFIPSPKSNWVPNPNAAPAPAPAPVSGDPLDAVIHFGKNKDKSLRSLNKKQLQWYIEEYKAEGYNGKPASPRDVALRTALDALSGKGAPARQEQPVPDDDLPF